MYDEVCILNILYLHYNSNACCIFKKIKVYQTKQLNLYQRLLIKYQIFTTQKLLKINFFKYHYNCICFKYNCSKILFKSPLK